MVTKVQSHGLTSIVAVGLNGEIGVQNGLPWRLKSDLRFFKHTTLDNVVVMGRKTYESVGGCLKGRQNIVLSHRASLFESHAGCMHSHSVPEALFLRNKFPRKEAFVIGGALTYAEFSPYVDRYLITVVKGAFPDADAFFDGGIIGDLDNWNRRELSVEKVSTEGADEYEFSVLELTYKRPKAIEELRKEAIASFVQRNHILKRKEFRRQANQGATLDQILPLA